MPSWVYWFIFLLVILIVIWIFYGRKNYPFVGFSPLLSPQSAQSNESRIQIDPITRTDIQQNIKLQQAMDPNICTNPLNTYPKDDQPLKNKNNSKMTSFRSKKELICCQILEDIYKKPFTSFRPSFLKNPETGYNLEIDCYNDELKIGLEYQGSQHYIYPNYTTQSINDFIQQLRRDQYKVEACDRNGVYLITVPYNIPDNLLRQYIEYYLPENVQSRLK